MACETAVTCEVIGRAVIGVNFKIGCTPCPIPDRFPADARKTDSEVKLYRDKFRKLGMRV